MFAEHIVSAVDLENKIYFKTWNMEDSLERRGITPLVDGGTANGEVDPDPPLTRGVIPR